MFYTLLYSLACKSQPICVLTLPVSYMYESIFQHQICTKCCGMKTTFVSNLKLSLCSTVCEMTLPVSHESILQHQICTKCFVMKTTFVSNLKLSLCSSVCEMTLPVNQPSNMWIIYCQIEWTGVGSVSEFLLSPLQ